MSYNLKDFPPKYLDQYGVEAQHPDKFICYWVDKSPGVVCGSIRTLRKGLKDPPKTVSEYLNILEKQSLPQTVSRLSEFIDVL